MTLLNLFRRRGTAPVARERLQILLSHERTGRGQPDLLGILREEILSTIAKHVTVERDNVQVRMDRGDTVSTLEIDVERRSRSVRNPVRSQLASFRRITSATAIAARPWCSQDAVSPYPSFER